MCVQLKVKAKNLADESRTIRFEENKRRQYLRMAQQGQVQKMKFRSQELRKRYDELCPLSTPEKFEIGTRLFKRHKELEERAEQLTKYLNRTVDSEVAKTVQSEIASLQRHRVIDVGQEARATNIARGFIKGLEYNQIEFNPRKKTGFEGPKWQSVHRMIRTYAPGKTNEFKAWMERAGLEVTQATETVTSARDRVTVTKL